MSATQASSLRPLSGRETILRTWQGYRQVAARDDARSGSADGDEGVAMRAGERRATDEAAARVKRRGASVRDSAGAGAPLAAQDRGE
jgi:hypothetical protein